MNESKEELYLQSVEDETRNGTRVLAALAAVLFPLFSILDYLSQRDHYGVLSLIRFSTTFFYIGAYFYFRSGRGLKRPIVSVNLILAIASLSITIMCMVLKGVSSRYYAGVNLVVLAGVLILPVSPKEMFKTVLMILGIYIVGVVSTEDQFQEEVGVFINNLFFLVATGVIGVVASYFKYGIRKESFFRSLEIQRSIEVLRKELHRPKEDIEGLAHQIVEKKEEVQSALEIRDRFISMASHELRTPLTSMKLQMDLAIMKIGQPAHTDEDVKKHIGNAYRQIVNIAHLVDEMLDVSRIQSGKFILNREAVELNDLAKNIVERNYADHLKNGKIEFHSTDFPLIGSWDPYKVEQVIVNLVNNAFRYGGDKPVKVFTGKEEQMAFVTIRDEGRGISEEDQAKIFQKFERGNNARTGGLGLGLYISQEIAAQHNGSLSLVSMPGEGASFTLKLPL